MIDQFQAAWQMEDFAQVGTLLRRAGELDPEDQVLLFRIDQQERWLRGHPVIVEAYLRLNSGLANRPDALLDFIYGEVLLREEQGQAPTADEYLARFPGLADPLRRQFRLHGELGQ